MKTRFDISADLQRKYDCLGDLLREMGHVLVAFSGGVDSTLLLKVARDTLGERVLAVTALSATTPGHEIRDAATLTRAMGVRHLEIPSHELTLRTFTQNPPDKCYICKKSRFGELVQLAHERDIPWVVDGENRDDDADWRPGSRAAKELGVRSPLREADLGKAEIRCLSQHLGLPTWNKPAYACLASRIPYGHEITPAKLKQIDAGESFLRELGMAWQVRVRHEKETARIEVEEDAIDRFMQPGIRRRVVLHFKALGFQYVALDLEGYRTGSLNRAITPKANP